MLFIIGTALTIVFLVLDKAGKLKGPMLLILLAVAAFLILAPLLNIDWVTNAQSTARFSRILLMVSVVGVAYSLIAVWVSPNKVLKAVAKAKELQTTQQGSVTPSPDEAKPNITPVGYQNTYITYDPSTQTFKEADTGIPALVAQFRNAHQQGKEISEGRDIRARIGFEPFDFYKKLDRTIPGFANVAEGIWLNEKNALVNFTKGETKTLILAVKMQDGRFGGFDWYEHQMQTIDGRELFLPKIPVLTADKYVVKVQITGGVKGEIADLHHFTITLRPEFTISFG